MSSLTGADQCDHYVYPGHKLGNIHCQKINDMEAGNKAIDFGLAKFTHLNCKCKMCPYLAQCYGGCPNHRFNLSSSGKPNHNYLCEGYFKYFQHTENAMKLMRMLVQSGKPVSHVSRYI
ncbi:SPASM domain-containing protein [Vibrio sp. ECSMB14105]|uniref:SPASM domain-containing protein n=1 Tax=Vibrio sp. ECSMB14105 TaxID=1638951 RepID=UPI0009E20358